MTDDQWHVEDFEAGDLALASGATLHNARLRYHRLGKLNAPKDNLILLPTYYGGAASGNHPWVTPGGPLDPERYCLVIPALIGAGESASPSNTPGRQGGAGFPVVSLYDNVRLQRRLLDAVFDGARLALVMGWSMGGMQALHWGALFPDRVSAILAVCASGRCHPFNRMFLEGVRAALTADPAWAGGHYRQPPRQGLAAFGRVYAGWAYAPAFFRQRLYRRLGFDSPEALLAFWARDHQAQDANDLLSVLTTWSQADLADHPRFAGDGAAARARLTMPCTLMPCTSDQYFRVEEVEAEAAGMPGARVRPLASSFGHIAGGPGRVPEVQRAVLREAARLLAGDAP
jgi:homoserine O-acetyltransferase